MLPEVQVVLCMDTEGPCVDPGNPELLGTWDAVDEAMDKLFDPAFRARRSDRAGGTIMDERSSRWVDSWFPVDYSNRAPLVLPGLVDWSSGVAEWDLYHPSPEDFRVTGAGRRRMARCLDLRTAVHALNEDDVVAAFERARSGMPAILS